MVFTSYDFLVFFFIVFMLYWLARRRQWQNLILLAASYVFYGWVHPWYAVLLGLSTLADYALALAIARARSRTRLFMILSLLLNLGVLGFFKYYNFFNENLVATLSGLGFQADGWLVRFLLPAGLSFYTLKKLAYVIDVARGTLEPTRDLVGFALFAAFFPQINSGPIDRAQKLLPQIQSSRQWSAAHFQFAWPLLVMGFFKKMVIADTLGAFVASPTFSVREPTALMILTAGLGFTLQIYADFSAYTDIARAVARLFGFDTSENFRSPYLSLTPTDFWNRWHITLSTWLRDYIFFPLRRKLLRARVPAWLADSLPPLITMLASGFWHGAGWTFLVWGLLFGVLIVVYQALGMGGAWKPSSRLARFLAWLVMFGFIFLTFTIFRAPSLTWLVNAIRSGLLLGSVEQRAVAVFNLSMTLALAFPLLLKAVMDRSLRRNSFLHEVYYAGATVVMLLFINSASVDFVYFQF